MADDINSGSTGSGRSASEPLLAGHLASRAAGTGPTGGAFGESESELQGFIRTATRGKSAVADLLGLLSGEGKTKVSNFTGAVKSLNTELKRAVDLLEKAKEGATGLPAQLGTGTGTGTRNGGDVVMPDQDRIDENAQRDRGGAGQGAAPPRGGGRLRMAGQGLAAVGGAAFYGLGRSFGNRLEGATYLDNLARQQAMALGGTAQNWSNQYAGIFRNTAMGGMENFSTAAGALQAGGVQQGSQAFTRMLGQVGAVRHAMPGADVGALASGAATMQHGAVAQGLRMRGITTFDMSYPEQMRKVLRAANGGREVTQELIALARPGTIYYDNLMALLGDDPQLVAQVLEFGRADAAGRAAGVDVTTRRGATAVGFGEQSIAGQEAYAAGEKAAQGTADQLESLNKQATEMYRNMERANEQLARLPESLKNMNNAIGAFSGQFQNVLGTTGLGSLTPALTGYLAGGGRFAGVRSAAGRLFRRGSREGGEQAARAGGRRLAGRIGSKFIPGVGWAATAYEAARGANWLQERENRLAQSVGHGIEHTVPGLGGINQLHDFFSGGQEPAGGLHGYLDEQQFIQGGDHLSEGISRKGFGGVKPHVAAAGNYLQKKFGPFPGGIGGVGQRANKSDHPRGLALDLMTNQNTALGDRVVAHLKRNWKHFGVKYIIWKQRIDQGSGWKTMSDRGSATANHMDHPHVSFYENPDVAPGYTGNVGEEEGGLDTPARTRSLTGGTGGFTGGRSELDIFNSFFGGAHSSEGVPGGQGEGVGDASGTGAGATFQGGSGRRLSDQELMQALQAAGFSGSGLVTAFAVAKAESGGHAGAFNGNTSTGDKSYGLFQINMLGAMGADRRSTWGLSSNEDLYDPVKNAQIAFKMSKGGTYWKDWSVHPDSRARGAKGKGYEQYLDDARSAFSGSGTGVEPRGGLETDAMPSVSSASVGYVAPSPIASARGRGSSKVDITVKVERATYSEAEKFAGWVKEFLEKGESLETIGGR